jgi:hypothetical protein
MWLLSIDVGIKNLAYCLFRDGNIRVWQVVDIGIQDNKNIQVLVNAVFDVLDNIVYNEMCEADYTKEEIIVLIENQPVMKNPVMKNLQVIIATYATMLERNGVICKVSVKFISASSKLKLIEQETGIKITKTYSANKKAAIAHVKTLIEQSGDVYMKEVFEGTKKKDDISDVYLQARWWMKNNAF